MVLSTGVAHPCDMDRPQVAFSFAILCGPEGFDGRRDQSGHSETPAATGAARNYESYTFACVSSR
jgi:hypothetical protein